MSKESISALAVELLGSFILVLAVLTLDKSTLNLPFFISLVAGLVVATMFLMFNRISGAQLNPAVTIGLFTLKRIRVPKMVAYVVVQLIGGALAYYLFTYFYGATWRSTSHFETKALVAEVGGAFIFSLGWASTIYQKFDTAKSAAVIGLSFMLALLLMSTAGMVTVDPAIALGMHTWVWGSSVLGPLLGSVIGFQVYKFLFVSDESVANSAQKKKISISPTANSMPQSKRSQVRA